jgi:hypothetical protein
MCTQHVLSGSSPHNETEPHQSPYHRASQVKCTLQQHTVLTPSCWMHHTHNACCVLVWPPPVFQRVYGLVLRCQLGIALSCTPQEAAYDKAWLLHCHQGAAMDLKAGHLRQRGAQPVNLTKGMKIHEGVQKVVVSVGHELRWRPSAPRRHMGLQLGTASTVLQVPSQAGWCWRPVLPIGQCWPVLPVVVASHCNSGLWFLQAHLALLQEAIQ